jgi:hypothetical protein
MQGSDEIMALQRISAGPDTTVPRARFGDMIAHDAEVAAMDPLGADSFFRLELAAFNEAENVSDLVGRSTLLVPSGATIARMSALEARATTRDLGMIAASLQRRGVGVKAVQGLEEALLRTAAITGEVPADTVYSYGPRNPVEPRTRKFTCHPSELVFIQSFRDGMANLPAALDLVVTAHEISIFDRAYVQCLRTADDFLAQMVEAIVRVRRLITPEFFTGVMRPFFDPKTIGGRAYLAPGGAQMPVIAVDQLIWGIGLQDGLYVSYFFENLEYQPPFVRELAVRLAHRPSLVQLASTAARERAELTSVACSSLRALDRILATLSKFRMPHLAVARANFGLRGDDDLGSGGYRPTILEYLIDRIREARGEVRQLLEEYGASLTPGDYPNA